MTWSWLCALLFMSFHLENWDTYWSGACMEYYVMTVCNGWSMEHTRVNVEEIFYVWSVINCCCLSRSRDEGVQWQSLYTKSTYMHATHQSFVCIFFIIVIISLSDDVTIRMMKKIVKRWKKWGSWTTNGGGMENN